MDVWMMPVLSRALERGGWHVLRFDLRGVRRSEGQRGTFDDDLVDVTAAADRVLDEIDGDGPLLVAGWSYGALLGLRCAVEDERVTGWAGVAPPLGIDEIAAHAPPDDALRGWTGPKLVLHGTEDDFTSAGTTRDWVDGLPEPKRLRLIDGGDHFLADHGDVLAREVAAFADEVGAHHDERAAG